MIELRVEEKKEIPAEGVCAFDGGAFVHNVVYGVFGIVDRHRISFLLLFVFCCVRDVVNRMYV